MSNLPGLSHSTFELRTASVSLFRLHGRIETFVVSGLNALDHCRNRLPRVLGVILVLAPRVDDRQVGRPVVAEHVAWIAVTRCQRAHLGTSEGGQLAFIDQCDPAIL